MRRGVVNFKPQCCHPERSEGSHVIRWRRIGPRSWARTSHRPYYAYAYIGWSSPSIVGAIPCGRPVAMPTHASAGLALGPRHIPFAVLHAAPLAIKAQDKEVVPLSLERGAILLEITASPVSHGLVTFDQERLIVAVVCTR